jgi:Aspartyl protease
MRDRRRRMGLAQKSKGDAKLPEKPGNCERANEQGIRTKTESYEANTKRFRLLTDPVGNESPPRTPDSRKRVVNGRDVLVTAAKLPVWDTPEQAGIGMLLKCAAYDLIWSFSIIIAILVEIIRALAETLDFLVGKILLSLAQEERKGGRARKEKRRILSSMDDPFKEEKTRTDLREQRSKKRRHSSDIADQRERGPVESPVKKRQPRLVDDSPEDADFASLTPEEDTPTVTPPHIRNTVKTTVPVISSKAFRPQAMTNVQVFRFPLPMPGSEGTPIFAGFNITDFLERYDDLCDTYAVEAKDKKTKLLRYCDAAHKEIVKSLPEFIETDKTWDDLVEALKAEFRAEDSYQLTYSMSFLSEFVKANRDSKGIKDYCRRYTSISVTLVDKKVLSLVDQGRLFLLGLPHKCRERILAKYRVDDLKPETYQKFKDFRKSALEFAQVDRTNEALQLQKEPSAEYKRDIKDLVQEHGRAIKVPEGAKKLAPVVMAGMPPAERAQIDSLTKEMAELKIYLSGLHDRRNVDISLAQPYVAPRNHYESARDNYDPHGTIHSFNVNPLTNVRDTRCWYCWDTALVNGAKHYTPRCPDYLRDFDAGVCHLDYDGRLCLGPRGTNAGPMSLNRERSHGVQVRLATAGTEFDINVKDRPLTTTPQYGPRIGNGTNTNPGHLEKPGRNESVRFANEVQDGSSNRNGTEADATDSRTVAVRTLQTVSLFGDGVDRGPDGDDIILGEALNIGAATITRNRGNSGSFRNPSKITKDRLEKETRYGTARRSLRVDANRESGTMVSEEEDNDPLTDAEADVEELADEEMIEAPKEPLPLKKRKYLRWTDDYETPQKTELALKRLMDNHINMRLGDLFSLPGVSLPRILNQRRPFVPRGGGDDYQVRDESADARAVQRVGNVQVLDNLGEAAAAFGLRTYIAPDKAKQLDVMSLQAVAPDTSNVPSTAMHTPKMEVIIHEKMRVRSTLDSGAEVNVMSKKLADRCNLAIETKKNLVFQGISPGRVFFLGACRRVKVEVGGSVNFVDFLVIDSGTADLLLGMPYFIETELTFLYDPDGAVRAKLRSGNRKRTVTVTVAGDPILVEETESEN